MGDTTVGGATGGTDTSSYHGGGTNTDVSGSQGLGGGMSASDINSMSATQFSNGLENSKAKDLVDVVGNPNVSKDKAQAALDKLEKMIPPPKPNPSDGDFGEDTPEEKLKKLIAKLKDKLSHGGTITAEDKKDLQDAVKAVADSQSSQGASSQSASG